MITIKCGMSLEAAKHTHSIPAAQLFLKLKLTKIQKKHIFLSNSFVVLNLVHTVFSSLKRFPGLLGSLDS